MQRFSKNAAAQAAFRLAALGAALLAPLVTSCGADSGSVAPPEGGTGGTNATDTVAGAGGRTGMMASGTGGSGGGDFGSGGAAGTGSGAGSGGRPGSGGSGGHSGSGGSGGQLGSGGSGGQLGSGGSAGTGGSGSDAGAHVIGKCDGLGAVGQWEKITPPYVVAHPTYTGVLVVLAEAQRSGVLYVGTDTDGVFRSSDCGATWTKVNTGRNASQLDSGRIWSAAIDPVQPGTLYALTGYGAAGLWKTTNGGVDWDQTLPAGSEIATTAGGFMERVAIDPTDHLHLIVNFHQNCTGGHTPTCFGETKDGGATWKVIDFPTAFAKGWEEASGVVVINPNVWFYGSLFGGLYRTTDAGTTWSKTSGTGGVSLGGTQPVFRAPDGTLYLSGVNSGVLSSRDTGATWTAIPNSGGQLTPVIGDGSRLFSGSQWGSGPTYVWAATYADPTHWSPVSTPSGMAGLYTFDYDPDHHVLYASCLTNGLWRMVTK